MSERRGSGSSPAPFAGLEGTRAFVTGGSRGIGAATVLLLAACGARVAVGYARNRNAAELVVAKATAMGADAFAVAGDLSHPKAAERVMDESATRLGGLDILIGNHGIWPSESVPISEMTFDQWRGTMDANLDSIFHIASVGARLLADDGRMVLVSSTAAQRGEAGHADYAASKGAMVSLVKSLCVELAPRGITVNSVAPGWVDTDLSAPVLRTDALAGARAGIPLGRVATAEDVAGPIVFLCTPMARHITGEILNVNGGSVLCG